VARYDVHEVGEGRGLVVDCQANTLSHLNSRFVIPLQLPTIAPLAARKLNPRFEIDGVDYVLVTQFAAAVPLRSLGRIVTSLRDEDARIKDALDMLMFGF